MLNQSIEPVAVVDVNAFETLIVLVRLEIDVDLVEYLNWSLVENVVVLVVVDSDQHFDFVDTYSVDDVQEMDYSEVSSRN